MMHENDLSELGRIGRTCRHASEIDMVAEADTAGHSFA